MVRTRKRFYGEEVSQSSSNIAHADRSRLKQFDQQEGKRQKKSKERSSFTFDMSKKDYNLQSLIGERDATFRKLLEQVCSGLDQSMGPPKKDHFWISFASKFCRMTGLEYKEGMAVACQHYCDELELLYKHYKKTCTPHSIDAPSPEYWAIMARIFGGCTPSTSTGRSSRSRGNTSSDTSSITSKKGPVKKLKLRKFLAELSYSGHLDFNDIERFEQYVSKSETRLHTFLGGTGDYRVKVVCKYLGKSEETEVQETEVQDSMVVRKYQPY